MGVHDTPIPFVDRSDPPPPLLKLNLTTLLLLLTPQAAIAAQETVMDPQEFNVFSLGEISYVLGGSSVDGLVGCVGDFEAANISLHTDIAAGPLTEVSLYAGGTVTLGNLNGGAQTNNGGIEAAGDVYSTSSTVFGPVFTGGDCHLLNGQIHGDVFCYGTFHGNDVDVMGVAYEGTPFQPTLNLGWYATYFLGQSNSRALIPQNATWTVTWGVLDIQVSQADSTITIPADIVNGLHTVTVNGPQDSQLTVLVTGQTFDIGSLSWIVSGGIQTNGIAIVCPDAVTGKLNGGPHLSLIAPRAEVEFGSGILTGNLIVGDLSGAGVVLYDPWTGFGKSRPGDSYCFGDPTAQTNCPCGNNNDGTVPGSGCANGVFRSGALLTATGVASVSADSLLLATSGVQPNTFGVYYQNDDSLAPGIHFGDGLMCSTTNLKRLGPTYSTSAGYSDSSNLPLPISVKGGVSAGETKYYGYWYRSWKDSPCGFNFNTSNAYAITWIP